MLFEEDKNIDNPTRRDQIKDRIIALIDFLKVDRGTFANNINVKPATLSHILTGRNEPSLTIVSQIHEAYPQASLDWLVYGIRPTPFEAQTNDGCVNPKPTVVTERIKAKKITEIRVFYDDNTFDVFVLKP